MKEKNESNFLRLMGFAENYKCLTYISLLLSGVSNALALLPFYYIWKIIKEVLEVMPNFENAAGIVKNGVIAVVFAVLFMIIYIASLMCSHTSAFRVQANMRKQMMHKIVQLPLGEIEKFGSGKLRKIVNDCSGATETYLAHQLPDMVGSVVTPIGLLIFLIAFDWRFGLISLIPIVLSFVVMMTFMTGKLITGSIFDNIRLAKPDADLDEVMSALEKAQCMDIIEKFDSGVDTVIGSNGVYLSGGETQRVAIARAILKNAPIVILDEATAFADPDNEVKIQKALNELSKNKTVIMIAHRLSTVKNADCIFVLQNGKLIEQGKTEELCSQNGVFASMLKNYLTYVKWKVEKEELK